jgi:hypothetical protein
MAWVDEKDDLDIVREVVKGRSFAGSWRITE